MNNLCSPCSRCFSLAPAASSGLLWAPLRHRWGAGARQDTHPCSQAVLQKPGGPPGQIQSTCGVCHQRWELYETDQSGASVRSAWCGGKGNTYLWAFSARFCLIFVFFCNPFYLRCHRTRWCCPTVLCECSHSSTKCVCWSRDRVLLRRWLTSILLNQQLCLFSVYLFLVYLSISV